jgi:fluoride exporter
MTTFIVVCAVAIGGVIGAPARYLVDLALGERLRSDLPWGTFTVNVVGSLILGVVVGLSVHHHVDPTVVALVGTGFCGSFTTFSTFAFETMLLGEDGRRLAAAATVIGGLGIGLLAGALGLALGGL